MKWTQSSILAAGLGFILVVNAVALGGVAYNRGGNPDSVLRLTERELQRPYGWARNSENSGQSLTLQWRTMLEDADPAIGIYMNYSGIGGSPGWLNEAKLASLGFDARPRLHANRANFMERDLPKQAFLVLEADGPTYQRVLERIRKQAAESESKSVADPNNKQGASQAKVAKEQLAREESQASRLFVVDAGLDVEQLRARYPDRSHYAIVQGEIRPQWIQRNNPGSTVLAGYISAVHADRIQVPLSYQSVLAFNPTSGAGGPYKFQGRLVPELPFDVSVAFGRRLEPWIVSAAKR